MMIRPVFLVLFTICLLSLSSLCFALGETQVSVVQSALGTNDRLTPIGTVSFESVRPNETLPLISLVENKTDQIILGFGGAITDSVANVYHKLSPAAQEEFLDLFFGPNGQQLTFVRATINSADFSVTSYSYDDDKGDLSLDSFSMEHDEELIIPLLAKATERARSSGRDLNIVASSWSPPAWMKKNNNMRNSDHPGLLQEESIFKAWALYFSKYLTVMKSHNLTMWSMSAQNEPHVGGQLYPFVYECCAYTAEQLKDFVQKYWGPQLRQDHPDVKLLMMDDQKPQLESWVGIMLNDSDSAPFVDGAAFHWYGEFLKNYQYVEEMHKQYPSLLLVATEATLEARWKQLDHWKQGQYYAIDIIGDLEAGTSAWVEWNLLLDESGGPVHPLGGECDAPLLASRDYQNVSIGDQFWHLGHFSRFMVPNSRRVISNQSRMDGLLATVAQTPTGSKVLVVLNTSADSRRFQVQDTAGVATFDMPPQSIQTLTYHDS